MLDPAQHVAKLVLDHSECAPVFQRHRIDFCCRGNMSITAACERVGADPAAVIDELEHAIDTRAPLPKQDPRALSTPALIAHIVSRHHDYLREALPFVQALAAKVSRVHGAHNPRLVELDAVVRELVEALIPHLETEERSLFPLLEAATRDETRGARELLAMHEDHLAVGALLGRLRDATEDYHLPEWACTSYRTLFAELAELERDVLTHVHLENHVLMPRFAAA